MGSAYSWALFQSRANHAINPPLGAPAIVGASMTGQKETEGTLSVVATLDVATAGVHLISLDAVRTSIRSSLALNNGNTYAAASASDDYSPDFPQYDLVVRAALAALGGSAHQSTLTKSTAGTEEATHALLAVLGGTVVEASMVNRASTPSVATHTSASFDVTGTKPALALAFFSGTGFSVGAAVQDATMVTAGYSDIIGKVNGGAAGVFKFVHSGVTAVSGHIPLRGWAATLLPGTGYTWQVTPTYQPSAGQAEGGLLTTIIIR